MVYAGFWKRVLAGFVDFLIFLPLILLNEWLSSYSKTFALLALWPFTLAFYIYNVYFISKWGQTIGKRVAKVKVVSLNGEPASPKQAMMRNSVDLILAVAMGVIQTVALIRFPDELWHTLSWMQRQQKIQEMAPMGLNVFLIIQNIWAYSELLVLLFNKKKRALHDFIAGTVVIQVEE